MALTDREKKIKSDYEKRYKERFGKSAGSTKKEPREKRTYIDERGREQTKTVNLAAEQRGKEARESGKTTGSGRLTSAFDKNRDKTRRYGSSRQEPTFDYEDFINRIEQKRIKAGTESAKKSAESQLSALGQRREAVAPAFRQARTGVKTQSELGKEAFRKLLASKALGGGEQAQGAEQQSEIAQNVQSGQALSGLQAQEAQELSGIAAQEQAVESGLARDIAALEAGGEASALDRILQMQMADRERELQRGDIEERRAYQEGLAEEQRGRQAEEQLRQEAISTIGQYGADYQAEINRRMAINPNDPLIPYLQMARQQKIAGMEQGQATAQQDATDFAMSKWTKGIPLTPQEMQLIGAPTSTKPKTGGAAVKPPKPLVSTNEYQQGINAIIDRLSTRDPITGSAVRPTGSQVVDATADYIVSIQDELTDEQAIELISKNGLSMREIQQAENRLELYRTLGR